MKLLSVLTPKFMKNLDNYFLLHHRLLWLTKVHYVLYYSALATIGTVALVWAYPLQASSSLPSKEFAIFLSVAMMLPAMIFWIYKQAMFSIEKNYGQVFPRMEQLRFGLYLLIFGFFVGFPVFFATVLQHRVAGLVDKETLRKEVYHLNAGNPYFPTNRHGDMLWAEDKASVEYAKSTNYTVTNTFSDGRDYFNFKMFSLSYWHSEAFRYDTSDELSSFRDLFLSTDSDEQSLTLIANYIAAFNRYSKVKIDLSPKDVLNKYKSHEVFSGEINASKTDIQDNLYEISEAQVRQLVDKDVFVALFSLAFSLSTLLLIFQNVKWLDFVLAAVSFGIGGIFYAMSLVFVGEIAGLHSDSTMLLGILLAFAFFFYKSKRINYLQTFSRFKVFSLMFANVISPFVLFLTIAWTAKQFHFPDYYMSGGEIQGWLMVSFATHAVVMMPIYRKLYLKMRALPKA